MEPDAICICPANFLGYNCEICKSITESLLKNENITMDFGGGGGEGANEPLSSYHVE